MDRKISFLKTHSQLQWIEHIIYDLHTGYLGSIPGDGREIYPRGLDETILAS